MYGLLVGWPVGESSPLRLSEDVTQVCVGFTASWCDETVMPDNLFSEPGPWKPVRHELYLQPAHIAGGAGPA
jgi:hypothetical protein